MARYRTFPEPVEVIVAITQPRYPVAGSFPVFAYGWRGERMYVEFRTGVGEKRFGWHVADHVKRRIAAYRGSQPTPCRLPARPGVGARSGGRFR